jgi:hypothetical protein
MITAPNFGSTFFPGGYFDDFLAPAGSGTIEYFGDDTIRISDVPPSGKWYANLVISGMGPKTISSPVAVQNNLFVNPESKLFNSGVSTELIKGNLIVHMSRPCEPRQGNTTHVGTVHRNYTQHKDTLRRFCKPSAGGSDRRAHMHMKNDGARSALRRPSLSSLVSRVVGPIY